MAERTARESIMDDWKIVSVIIGILGALLGVYFRESMRKAEKQKITAVRLEAYLNEVIREFLEGELKDIFLLGAVLQEKSIEALKKGGREAYLKVHEDYKKLLEDIRKMIADGPPEINPALCK
jgi:type II secretory pathway pseudopilin PulG